MSQAPVAGVKRVGAKNDSAGATQPGQLVRDDGGQWDFMGNDKVSPTQVTNRILHLESTKYSADQSGLPSGLSPDVARQVAQALMKEQNPQLSTKDPDEAIKNGEKFTANVSQLKAAIAPFLNNPGAVSFLTDSTANNSGKFGDVRSHGLSLPYERN